jgi:hypothetical protein
MPIIPKYYGCGHKQDLPIVRWQAVIWTLKCILHPGKHPNRLDGLQSTSRTKRLEFSQIEFSQIEYSG